MSGFLTNDVIAGLARGQHGRVAVWQLAQRGVAHWEVEAQVRRGRLTRAHRGVYAVVGAPLTDKARWMAGVLAGGEHGCLVLESAASLWGMYRRPLLRPIHVNCPTKRENRDGLIFHRLTLEDEVDVTTRRGIRVTRPLRTLADLRPRTPRDEWEALVVTAVAKGVVGDDALTLFRVAKPLTRSRLERVAHRLVSHGLPRAEVNFEVLGRERDLVWPAHKVVVEIDGPHHLLPPQIHRDNQRDRELTLHQWIPLRYGEDELLAVPGDLATLLLRAPFT